MKIYSQKEHLAALFQPSDYIEYMRSQSLLPSTQLPEKVILAFSKAVFNSLNEKFTMEPIGGNFGNFFRVKENPHLGIIYNFGVGAPVTSIILEELSSLGVQSFLIVGTAGSLNPNLKIGDQVLVDGALSAEGTSKHYYDEECFFKAHPELIQKLRSHLPEMPMATTWTTDCPYRETKEEIIYYQHQGISTVDMEASAVFAIAQKKKIKAAALFVISDTLYNFKWNPQFKSDKVHKSLKNLALKCAEAF